GRAGSNGRLHDLRPVRRQIALHAALELGSFGREFTLVTAPDAQPFLLGSGAFFLVVPRCASVFRAFATSSGPSASPCADLVPCLLGAPQPMMVLQQMIEGWSLRLRAFLMAAATASASWPSTFLTTCQPYASKRFGVSSVNQPPTLPSMLMPLSS